MTCSCPCVRLVAGCSTQVRSESEVSGSPLPNGKPFVHCPVTMGDTSQLEAKAAELLPDKSATILCFCGVGGRVMGAKKVLDGLGYTSVMNVGGLKDLVAAGVV
jgi:rhodanese-related sulfurtransferase